MIFDFEVFFIFWLPPIFLLQLLFFKFKIWVTININKHPMKFIFELFKFTFSKASIENITSLLLIIKSWNLKLWTIPKDGSSRIFQKAISTRSSKKKKGKSIYSSQNKKNFWRTDFRSLNHSDKWKKFVSFIFSYFSNFMW